MASFSLHYQNDTDRANGCAGMMISLLSIGAEDHLAEICLDAPAGSNMVMGHDFGFRGNPRMAAKVVWANTMNELRTVTAMLMGNIFCRCTLSRDTTVSGALMEQIRSLVRSEGADLCGLEADEADNLFSSCRDNARRLFSNYRVVNAATALSSRLVERRTLSCVDALELLSSLGLR